MRSVSSFAQRFASTKAAPKVATATASSLSQDPHKQLIQEMSDFAIKHVLEQTKPHALQEELKKFAAYKVESGEFNYVSSVSELIHKANALTTERMKDACKLTNSIGDHVHDPLSAKLGCRY